MSRPFRESKLAFLYLWFTKAKYTMGIFYVFFIFIYLLFGAISEGPTVTLDLFTSIEMVFACFFIGVAQQAIIPIEKLTRPRCALWVLTGSLITLAFSLAFGWFDRFPLWCFYAFNLIIAAGMGVLLISYDLELHRDTKKLNQHLARFQQTANKKHGEG